MPPERCRPRVVIVTNSQGTSLGVPPQGNYPSLLRALLADELDMHQLLISGWTLREAEANLVDNVIALRPQLAIMQFGVVECAQRILSDREKRFWSAMPLGRVVTAMLHRRRDRVLRWRRKFGLATRVMEIGECRAILSRIVDALAAAGIPHLFVAVPPFADGGEALRHPFINEDAAAFNAALEAVAKEGFLPASALAVLGDRYQTGTVHLDPDGHALMARILQRAIVDRLGLHRDDRAGRAA